MTPKKNKVHSQEATFNSFSCSLQYSWKYPRILLCTARLASLFPFWKRKREKRGGKGWKECFLWLVGECTFYSHCYQVCGSLTDIVTITNMKKCYMNNRAKPTMLLYPTISAKPSLVAFTELMNISRGGIFTAPMFSKILCKMILNIRWKYDVRQFGVQPDFANDLLVFRQAKVENEVILILKHNTIYTL